MGNQRDLWFSHLVNSNRALVSEPGFLDFPDFQMLFSKDALFCKTLLKLIFAFINVATVGSRAEGGRGDPFGEWKFVINKTPERGTLLVV